MNAQEPLPNRLIKQQQEVDSCVYPFSFGPDSITLCDSIKYFIFNWTRAFIWCNRPPKKLKKTKFELDQIWCSPTNDKFEHVGCQSGGQTCRVVDTSYWHHILCLYVYILQNFRQHS